MFTGSKSLAVRGRELKWRIPNDAKRIFMELSRKDFLKVVSGISIFKALGLGKGQQPHPRSFHYTVECVIYRGGQ
jgi:hypothetical protein